MADTPPKFQPPPIPDAVDPALRKYLTTVTTQLRPAVNFWPNHTPRTVTRSFATDGMNGLYVATLTIPSGVSYTISEGDTVIILEPTTL